MTPSRLAALAATALIAGAGLTGCAEAPTAEVGDCLSSQALSEGEITDIPTASCDAPHDLEVYHTFDLPDGDYPGDDEVLTSAEDGCLEAFEPFVGAPYEESELYFMFLHPAEESWSSAKDREIICILESPEPVSQSLRGSGV